MSEEVQNTQEEYIEITEAELQQIIAQASENADITNAERVENTLFDDRIIYLSGVVDEDLTYNLIPLIHYYNSLDDRFEVPVEERIPIRIYVDSEGGEVYKGLNILSTMKSSKTPIWTYLEGSIGMSMGMVLFLGGHVRHMGEYGTLLYHQIRFATDVQTLEEAQNLLNHYLNVQNKIDNFIIKRTSIPKEKLEEYKHRNIDWYIDFETAKFYDMFDQEI